MKSPTVSVLIAAYNEEKNIERILKDCFAQNQKDYVLREIVVASDGSTDKTAQLIEQTRHPSLIFHNFPIRRGKAACLNDLYKTLTGDIVISLDADISIEDPLTFHYLICRHINEQASAVSGKSTPLPAASPVERAAQFGQYTHNKAKEVMGTRLVRYRYMGRIFSCNRLLLEDLHIPPDTATDVYIYYFLKQKNIFVISEPKAEIFFKSPATIKDFLNQYKRNLRSNKSRYFPYELIKKEDPYTMVLMLVLFWKEVVRHPIAGFNFIFLYTSAKILSKFYKRGPMWHYISTTKHLS